MPEPTYEALRDALRQLEKQREEQRREEEEEAREQIRTIRVAMGWEPEEPPPPPPPKPVKTCRQIRENGKFCGSVAVQNRDFCVFHVRERARRLRMARARARRERWRLQVPPLEDLYAVQVSIGQVVQALADDQVETQRGRAILYGLQQAATNLCRPREMWESRPFESHEQMELPGLEAEFGLPEGLDLNAPPEVAFPETETTPALSDDQINSFEVTPLDMELMELRQREGPEATWRRLQQADKAEQRRYQQAQAQLAHARYVVRAAAQNAARETVFVERTQAAVAAAEANEQAATAQSEDASRACSAGEAAAGRKEPQPAVTDATEAAEKKLG